MIIVRTVKGEAIVGFNQVICRLYEAGRQFV